MRETSTAPPTRSPSTGRRASSWWRAAAAPSAARAPTAAAGNGGCSTAPPSAFPSRSAISRSRTVRAGHVEVRFAFGSGSSRVGRGVKDDVIKAVTDSLTYYEDRFGPYPLDDLTVTTANRGFSQGMLGFVTLSDFVLNDLGMWNRFFGLPDRRLVVAHEIAHQWWGNQVGWTSYRDQWI